MAILSPSLRSQCNLIGAGVIENADHFRGKIQFWCFYEISELFQSSLLFRLFAEPAGLGVGLVHSVVGCAVKNWSLSVEFFDCFCGLCQVFQECKYHCCYLGVGRDGTAGREGFGEQCL